MSYNSMRNDKADRHPLAVGVGEVFSYCADELNWAHGKPSSRDYDRHADEMQALGLRNDAETFRRDAAQARKFEARFARFRPLVNPYYDPLIVRLERGNAEREAEQRKKSQRRGRTRL